MPRRNNRRRRYRRIPEEPDEREVSLESLARDLVRRGKASPQILGFRPLRQDRERTET